MDFQKPENPSRRMMTKTTTTTTTKKKKYDDEEGSDNNAEAEDDVADAEEKKQKRLSAGRRVSAVNCQAEKCTVDLTEAKRYHRRHKVCEFHAKAPSVLVSALRQRFCQQCSRFHELSEFDEAKRSCRRRLAGHNERRRKNSLELQQGEGGSASTPSTSSRPKGSTNPLCRPVDHDRTSSRVTQISFPASNPASYKFQIT